MNLWIKRIGLDWLIASETRPVDNPVSAYWSVTDNEPCEKSLQRWSFSEKYDHIEVAPCMPDRPLVVKTHLLTSLPPGGQATFYVSIPLWVSLSAVRKTDTVAMTKHSSQTLSNTWFGNHDEGEFCYALKTSAVRTGAEAGVEPHRALCPVVIYNKEDIPLPVQKICIRAKHLSIYQCGKQTWTNRISVTFKGNGKSSKVEYDALPPSEAGSPILLKTAEEKSESGLIHTLGQSFVDLF